MSSGILVMGTSVEIPAAIRRTSRFTGEGIRQLRTNSRFKLGSNDATRDIIPGLSKHALNLNL
jgi:hypothetical protein